MADSCTVQSSVESHFNVPSSVKNSTYNFNENGWKYGNLSSYTMFSSYFDLPNLPFEVSFILNEVDKNGLGLFLTSDDYIATNYPNGNAYLHSSIVSDSLFENFIMGTEYHLRVYNDKLEIYKENTHLKTINANITSLGKLEIGTGGRRYVRIKDLKIKPL